MLHTHTYKYIYVIFLDVTTVLSFSPSLVSVVDVFIVILLFLFYFLLLQYFTFQLHRDSFSFRPWLLLRLLKPKTMDMNKLLSVSPCVRADRSAVLQGTFWRCSFLWSRFEIWNIWFTITLSGRAWVTTRLLCLFCCLWSWNMNSFSGRLIRLSGRSHRLTYTPPAPPHHPPSWQRFSDVCPRSPANPPLVVTFGMSGRILNPSYVRLGLMYVQMVWTAVGRSSAVVTLVVFILVILFIQKS